MEQENTQEMKRLYLSEFQYFNGEFDILLYILDINTDKMVITIAVNNQGKISTTEYDLKRNKNNELYFEFGTTFDQIKINDFDETENTKEN
jgi:hypothetical protein